MDGAGNVYITDTGNHRIRRVDPSGIITTIAGTGEQGKSGDNGLAVAAQFSYPQGVAVDGNGDLYIADTDNHRIRRVDATGTITTIAGTGKQGFRGDGGPAVTAQLSRPESVAVDGFGQRLHRRFRQPPHSSRYASFDVRNPSTPHQPDGNGCVQIRGRFELAGQQRQRGGFQGSAPSE